VKSAFVFVCVFFPSKKGKTKSVAVEEVVAVAAASVGANVAKTSKDPNFLKEYFAHSRLHHLSAWRSAFQEELAEEFYKEMMSDVSKEKEEVQHKQHEPIILHVRKILCVCVFFFCKDLCFRTENICLVSLFFCRS
jgi:hypothetical protein